MKTGRHISSHVTPRLSIGEAEINFQSSIFNIQYFTFFTNQGDRFLIEFFKFTIKNLSP